MPFSDQMELTSISHFELLQQITVQMWCTYLVGLESHCLIDKRLLALESQISDGHGTLNAC